MKKEGKNKKRLNISLIVAAVVVLLVVLEIISAFREFGGVDKIRLREYGDDTIADEKRNNDAETPVFSAESGFYDEEFSLTLSGPEGATILYTLDGSDPAGSVVKETYVDPISIYDNTTTINKLSAKYNYSLAQTMVPNKTVDKGIVVRACLKFPDGTFGPTVTKSYFVGKTAAYYKDLKVISLVTNPYNIVDEDTGIYVIGSAYKKWKRSDDYNPTYENWNLKNPTNYNQSGKEWERPAIVQVFEKGEIAFEQAVGIRLAGKVSRSNVQKSFRLYARSEYGDSKLRYTFFDGLTDIDGKKIKKFDKVTLRNAGNDSTDTCIRDNIIQSLVSGRDVSIQADEPCMLFLDGEFWGFYHIKERLEDYYFQSHYDIKKENVTIIKNSDYEGNDEIIGEYQNFFNWAMYADFSDDANYEKACKVFDMQSFMDYFAIETYINNKDWLYTDTNNCMMWRANEPVDGNEYGDGKWRFALFDTEYSCNLYGQTETKPEFDLLNDLYIRKTWTNPAALFYKFLENEGFRKNFEQTYIEVIDECFNPEHVNEVIDTYVEEYGSAISAGLNRYTNTGTDSRYLMERLEPVKDFFNKRPEYAREYLSTLLGRY